jgi:hypothetical protein
MLHRPVELARVFSKFEFPAHASGADETLVSFGLRSNQRRYNVARCGGITLYQVAELIVISSHDSASLAECHDWMAKRTKLVGCGTAILE